MPALSRSRLRAAAAFLWPGGDPPRAGERTYPEDAIYAATGDPAAFVALREELRRAGDGPKERHLELDDVRERQAVRFMYLHLLAAAGVPT